MAHPFRIRRAFFLYVLAFALVGVPASAQNRAGVPAVPPPDRPVVLQTTDVARIRVVPIVGGLSHPWGLAFRRNGDILVTERDKGILRVIRDGQLLERSVPGVPEVYTDVRRAGLMDIAIHPDDDSLVYLTYSQAAELDPSEEVPTWAYDGQRGSRVALARGRLDGGALTEVRDLFVTNRIDLGVSASRIVFGPDGLLYMTVGVGRSGPGRPPSMRRIPALITERYCVCAMTEPSPTTIHSLATPTTCRKSIRWGIGTRLGWASTLRRVISGRPRTRRKAATRRTLSSRVPTTAGRLRRTAANIPAFP